MSAYSSPSFMNRCRIESFRWLREGQRKINLSVPQHLRPARLNPAFPVFLNACAYFCRFLNSIRFILYISQTSFSCREPSFLKNVSACQLFSIYFRTADWICFPRKFGRLLKGSARWKRSSAIWMFLCETAHYPFNIFRRWAHWFC